MGADYFEDPDGIIVSQPKRYVDKLADTYKSLFNSGFLHKRNQNISLPYFW